MSPAGRAWRCHATAELSGWTHGSLVASPARRRASPLAVVGYRVAVPDRFCPRTCARGAKPPSGGFCSLLGWVVCRLPAHRLRDRPSDGVDDRVWQPVAGQLRGGDLEAAVRARVERPVRSIRGKKQYRFSPEWIRRAVWRAGTRSVSPETRAMAEHSRAAAASTIADAMATSVSFSSCRRRCTSHVGE